MQSSNIFEFKKKIISSNWQLKTNSWKWGCLKKEYAFRNDIFPIMLCRTIKLLLTTQCTATYANIITCAAWHIQIRCVRFFFVYYLNVHWHVSTSLETNSNSNPFQLFHKLNITVNKHMLTYLSGNTICTRHSQTKSDCCIQFI